MKGIFERIIIYYCNTDYLCFRSNAEAIWRCLLCSESGRHEWSRFYWLWSPHHLTHWLKAKHHILHLPLSFHTRIKFKPTGSAVYVNDTLRPINKASSLYHIILDGTICSKLYPTSINNFLILKITLFRRKSSFY